MNSVVSPPTGTDGERGRSAAAWWRARTARERVAVGLAAAVVALAALWALLQPAWQTLQSAPQQMAVLDAQWQQMQRQAAEARELRAMPPVAAEQAKAVLTAASERLGDKGRLIVQGDRATLMVNGMSATALRDWLQEARSGARARPLEARLTRGASGYTGSVVLAIGGAP